MEARGGLWRLMEAHGGLWRLKEAHGGSWRFMEAHGGLCTVNRKGLIWPQHAILAFFRWCRFGPVEGQNATKRQFSPTKAVLAQH